ncbi:MAG: hypothetical protein MK098_12045 [Marinovum sp.]|nr:hypothetical protein [Marinovum sp.]
MICQKADGGDHLAPDIFACRKLFGGTLPRKLASDPVGVLASFFALKEMIVIAKMMGEASGNAQANTVLAPFSNIWLIETNLSRAAVCAPGFRKEDAFPQHLGKA